MKHVVQNIFTLNKLAKCKQFQLVNFIDTNSDNKKYGINKLDKYLN